jgi:hypothetical protein
VRIKGRYRNQTVELEHPLELNEGAEVELEIVPADAALREAWAELGMSRLEQEWDNPADAVYDDWKKLYGA